MDVLIRLLGADVGRVLARFPTAITSAAALTIVAIFVSQGWLPDTDETLFRVSLGLFGFTIYAVAGQLFRESRPEGDLGGKAVAYALPAIVFFAPFVTGHQWLVPEMLPLVGIFWLSVAAFVSPQPRLDKAEVQARFWWLNHRAVTTGAIALIGLGLILLGLLAIERSLALLFGLELSRFIYGFLVPLAGLFLVPVYWFATIPRLDEFNSDYLEKPDFLSRAVGFLGQFVLSPLLLAYALILLAYAVQIVVTWQLPQGVLGWMVLAFTITGAANWLVLYPKFMDERRFVRVFKSVWFWLTLLPLALYALATFVRISAYGLTEERYLLIAGGVWALALAVLFLTRRFADIRLIPGLAGLIFLILSFGPWNLINLPESDQLSRLDRAIPADPTVQNAWNAEAAAQARGAIGFLNRSDESRAKVRALLATHGIEVESGSGWSAWREALHLPSDPIESGWDYANETFDPASVPVELGDWSVLAGNVSLGPWETNFGPDLTLTLYGERMIVKRGNAEIASFDLNSWLIVQRPEKVTPPDFVLEIKGVPYRFVGLSASLQFEPNADGTQMAGVTNLDLLVFRKP
ncbi:MAG: DUF4153 domain-containing protein [Hyphomicrobiaceae bacterium]|nr:DUF4153 domain-containing protein [Hyphomicrobiaceae bacterium]